MTSTVTPAATVAARVIDAFQTKTFDAEAFTADATAWHNFDELDLRIADSFAMVAAINAVVPDFTFAERRHLPATGEVSVAQYTLTGTLPDGSALRVPACLVVREVAGRVARIEEYLDATQLAPLVTALEAAG